MAQYSHWFIRARLKTRQLLLVVALAEEGNVHRAAEVLNMTQPAASKLLKDLEDVLGVELFERLPRGMRPTWYGESMIRHARMVLSSLNQAHDEISALKAGQFGRVGIGSITAPGLSILPQAIALVKSDHPSLKVTVEIDTSPVLLEWLAKGHLDMALARLSVDHDKSLYRYEQLVEEPICAMVRPGHPLGKVSGLTLRDVSGAGWIVPPAGSVLRHRFDLMFQEEDLPPPENVIETSALLFVTKMLQESDLIAVVSEDVGQYYASHGLVSVLSLDMPCRMDAYGIITRRDREPSPAAKVMMKRLKEVCRTAFRLKLGNDWG